VLPDRSAQDAILEGYLLYGGFMGSREDTDEKALALTGFVTRQLLSKKRT